MSAHPSPPRAHGGQALLAALVLLLVLGAGALLGAGELRTRATMLTHARSVIALAQARAALIGYAVSYDESHPGEGYGFLPCPDSGNTGSTPIGACGARGQGAIGRLPWRTLGLPDLRDGWGECLWYAVAGSVKHNPKALMLNWDSPGQFVVHGADGHRIAAAGPDGRAVAIVFAPGPALAGQVRAPASGRTCPGGDSAVADLAHYLDGDYPATVDGTLDVFSGGDLPGADLIAWIGIDDIFDALRRRADHAARIDALISDIASALDARLAEPDFTHRHFDTEVGALRSGVLPNAADLGLPAAERARIDHWRDQIRVAICTDSDACIEITSSDTATTRHCRAALLFAGERIRHGAGRQLRATAAQRADPAQYFEGTNALHLKAGVPRFEGAERFAAHERGQPAVQDIVRCLS